MYTSHLLVLLVAATFAVQLCDAALPNWTPPLSTQGRYIIDASGNRFRLKSGNWHGGSGTWTGDGDINDNANHHIEQNSHTLPLGLQYIPINTILDTFEKYGINSIRLQFSNQMIHDTTIIQDDWVSANPQFKGMTPIQVYDAVITALTARGFAVIINNHTNLSKWCCGVGDGNERWDKSQSYDTWVADWVMMVQRYKSNKRVVGADLYNEVRRDYLEDPEWGPGGSTDWWSASQGASDNILLANPDILVIIEGINWSGIPVDELPHSRPTLTPARYVSHTLLNSTKLVYSAHFYAYTGPNASGASGIGETSDPRYRDLSQSDLYFAYQTEAAFVALDTDMHYTAPLWMSEFGVEGQGQSPADQAWFLNTLNYLQTNDLDFAIWPLVGFHGKNISGDSWALLNWNIDTNSNDGLYDGNDWRASAWASFINSTTSLTGKVPQVTKWHMLNMDNGDYVQSLRQRTVGDWDIGARKAMCPDGSRLIAMSYWDRRGLCTDYGSYTWNAAQSLTRVISEQNVDINTDWATGYTKFECPTDNYLVGYAFRNERLSSIVCAQSSTPLSKNSSTTVWFDQVDNRRDNIGGEYAKGDRHGGCMRNEYMAGVAFTTRISSPLGNPAAILCRR